MTDWQISSRECQTFRLQQNYENTCIKKSFSVACQKRNLSSTLWHELLLFVKWKSRNPFISCLDWFSPFAACISLQRSSLIGSLNLPVIEYDTLILFVVISLQFLSSQTLWKTVWLYDHGTWNIYFGKHALCNQQYTHTSTGIYKILYNSLSVCIKQIVITQTYSIKPCFYSLVFHIYVKDSSPKYIIFSSCKTICYKQF